MYKKIIICSLLASQTLNPVYARSTRNHLIKSVKSFSKALADPAHGVFVLGPRKVKETWNYEVHEREKEEDRNTLRGKLFAIWRAPGDELKGTIDGISNCAIHLGDGVKELISIFFSD